MVKPKAGLGRGLGALLGERVASLEEEGLASASELPLQKLEPNPLQPRKQFDPEQLQALADSIAAHGIIQPLTVRPGQGGFYQIIAGERRWRAARMAGLEMVPVHILQVDDRQVMELALIENLQRTDLNPVEEAQGYQTLIQEYGLTQEQAAESVGKSRPAVANALRLLSLDEELLALVENGSLSAGHGRALLAVKQPQKRKAAAQRIMALQLSVRQAETLCQNLNKEPAQEPAQEDAVDYIGDCERQLTRHLGRRVRIINGKRKGRFELEFYGQEDLNRLLFALQALDVKEEQA